MINKSLLLDSLKAFSKLKILVLGDLILDEYLLASPSRISREAPVIIFKYLQSKYALGGAANAAANIASMGARVSLLGSLSNDSTAKDFTKLCKDPNIDLQAIEDLSKPTTRKLRLISTSHENNDQGTALRQQVARIDYEENAPLSDEIQTQFLNKFRSVVSCYDAILLSDYSNGIFTSKLAQNIISLASCPIIVDSNGDLRKFRSAEVFTPNQPDIEKNTQGPWISEQDFLDKALQLRLELSAKALVITRGAKGMTILQEKENPLNIPALNLSEVFDVTGAGDTVSAHIALGRALGLSFEDSAILGNLAASIVVRKYGTATVSVEELKQLIQEL